MWYWQMRDMPGEPSASLADTCRMSWRCDLSSTLAEYWRSFQTWQRGGSVPPSGGPVLSSTLAEYWRSFQTWQRGGPVPPSGESARPHWPRTGACSRTGNKAVRYHALVSQLVHTGRVLALVPDGRKLVDVVHVDVHPLSTASQQQQVVNVI